MSMDASRYAVKDVVREEEATSDSEEDVYGRARLYFSVTIAESQEKLQPVSGRVGEPPRRARLIDNPTFIPSALGSVLYRDSVNQMDDDYSSRSLHMYLIHQQRLLMEQRAQMAFYERWWYAQMRSLTRPAPRRATQTT